MLGSTSSGTKSPPINVDKTISFYIFILQLLFDPNSPRTTVDIDEAFFFCIFHSL